MMVIKHIMRLLFFIITISLLLFIGAMTLYPEQTSNIIGYRFYTVLTNSMEPKIPTYSLVFNKMIDKKEPIKPNTIVTFKANRLGDEILLTHYFRKTQIGNDGKLYYRTQGANATDYDNYETSRSDIIGLYMFHIPYVGKVFLFLKSPFGFIMYGELFIIYLVNKIVKTRWIEKADDRRKKALEDLAVVEQASITSAPDKWIEPFENIAQPMQLYLSDVCIEQQGHRCNAYAVIHNNTNEVKQNVFVELRLYDAQHHQRKRYVIRLMKNVTVMPNGTHSFCFRFNCMYDLDFYTMEILG